jgi:outer membrane protein OmpA-like peptidoglycan-associated protein
MSSIGLGLMPILGSRAAAVARGAEGGCRIGTWLPRKRNKVRPGAADGGVSLPLAKTISYGTMQTTAKHLGLWAPVVAMLIMAGTFTGCQDWSRTARGAAVGAGAGAVVGGVIGKATGSTARGAIIGAAVGGTAGAIIGRQLDQQAEELERELENARVETVQDDEGNTAGIRITFDNAILFDFDSAALRPEARRDLSDLAASLQRHQHIEGLVVGHTDSTGPAEYNQGLSERRAESVAVFIAQQGVAPGRLLVSGMGETQPIASNATAEGRQLNRRVEIALYANEAYRQQLQQEHGG